MVDRTVLVRLKADPNDFVRGMGEAAAAVKGLDSQINKTNDRTAWLAQGLLALAPAVVPLAAAGVPVLSGIATQATVAAAAVGTMALAFSGVGDGLKALNTWQQTPTLENFVKLQQAMEKLGPDGEHLVRYLDEVGRKVTALQMTARAKMFPGLESGIDDLLRRLPDVQLIVQKISSGIGQLMAQGGRNLAGSSWDGFFHFLETDARPILLEMGRTLGNVAHGFADMLVAFAPLSRGFSTGLLEISRSFAQWAANLQGSDGFQSFLEYVEDSGPKALDFLGALAHFGIELVHAYAPLGSVMLPLLTQLVGLLGDLADTPLGQFALVAATLTSLYGRMRAIGELTGSGASKLLFGNLGLGVKNFKDDVDKVKGSLDAAKSSVISWRSATEQATANVATAHERLAQAQMKAAQASEYEARMLGKYNGTAARAAVVAEDNLTAAVTRASVAREEAAVRSAAAMRAEAAAQAALTEHTARASAEHSAAMQVGDLSQVGNIDAVLAQAAAAEEKYAADLARIPELEAAVQAAHLEATAAIEQQVIAQNELNAAQKAANLGQVVGETDQVTAAQQRLEAAQRRSVTAADELRAAEHGLAASESALSAAQSSRGARLASFGRSAALTAVKVGVLGAALSPLPDKLGLSNTAMYGMIGSAFGPWGTAIGAATGLAIDFAHANDDISKALKNVDEVIASGSLDQLQQKYSDLAEANKKAQDQSFSWSNVPKNYGLTAIPIYGAYHTLSNLGDIKQDVGDLWAKMTGGQTTAEQTKAALDKTAKAIKDEQIAEAAAASHNELVEHYAKIREANRETADSFVDLSQDMKKPTLTLDALLKRWRQQAAAEAAMGTNIATAIARGANPEALQQVITKLGPAAGLAIQQLAKGGRSGIDSLNAAFARGQKAANLYNNSLNTVSDTADNLVKGSWQNLSRAATLQTNFLTNLGGTVGRLVTAYDGVPADVRTEIALMGMPKTVGDINKIGDLLNLTAQDRQILMALIDNASPKIRSIAELLATLKDKTVTVTTLHKDSSTKTANGNYNTHASVNGHGGKYATGGLLRGPGTSTSDSIPVRGSDGEFMMRAAAVQKYGVGFMYDVNALRLAKGGLVTRRAFEYQRPSSSRATVNASLAVGDLRVTGTLQTPFGPAEVAGIARVAAADQINQQSAFESYQG